MCDDPRKISTKSSYPKNINCSENPKKTELQYFEKKIIRAYVCMKISEYHPPPPPPETVCKNMTPNIIISSIFDEVSNASKRKAAVKSQQSPDPRARLSPVPSQVSCPVVSDGVQFKLQTSNLKSLDIIHDALH